MQTKFVQLLVPLVATVTVLPAIATPVSVPIRPFTANRTSITMLIPTVFPGLATVRVNNSSTRDSYALSFYLPNSPRTCTSTPCWYGDFSAKQGTSIEMPTALGPRSFREEVMLVNGVKGTFIYSAGSYDIGTLIWIQNGTIYRATIKNGKRDAVVQMANSAIRNPAPPGTVFKR